MIELRGRLILCKYLETEETLPGGRIALLEGSRNAITAQQGQVVAAGPGEYDEDGDWVPQDPDIKPGAWVLHKAFARKPWHDEAFFILHADDVVAILG